MSLLSVSVPRATDPQRHICVAPPLAAIASRSMAWVLTQAILGDSFILESSLDLRRLRLVAERYGETIARRRVRDDPRD